MAVRILRKGKGMPARFRQNGGGIAMGPSHEQGGIPVVTKDGSPAIDRTSGMPYEIEGDERVFSKEDTMEIDRMAIMVLKASQAGNQQQANQLALKLGYAVTKMVAEQEHNQQLSEQQLNEAANQWGGKPGEPTSYIEDNG